MRICGLTVHICLCFVVKGRIYILKIKFSVQIEEECFCNPDKCNPDFPLFPWFPTVPFTEDFYPRSCNTYLSHHHLYTPQRKEKLLIFVHFYYNAWKQQTINTCFVNRQVNGIKETTVNKMLAYLHFCLFSLLKNCIFALRVSSGEDILCKAVCSQKQEKGITISYSFIVITNIQGH